MVWSDSDVFDDSESGRLGYLLIKKDERLILHFNIVLY